ncbi:MAG: hypothetical protein CM15mP16_00190 [Candidatus Pelagibacterales bacterium]|nr:MAG: hypothetical protein CM15mP16_00190 [Pelagibacterales bacterium]
MGTIGLGETQDSAVDGMDSNPACFSLVNCWNVAFSGKGGGTGIYDDGDAESGNSIAYSKLYGWSIFCKSLEVWNLQLMILLCLMLLAATSIMGATIKAGVSQIDYKGTTDIRIQTS